MNYSDSSLKRFIKNYNSENPHDIVLNYNRLSTDDLINICKDKNINYINYKKLPPHFLKHKNTYKNHIPFDLKPKYLEFMNMLSNHKPL